MPSGRATSGSLSLSRFAGQAAYAAAFGKVGAAVDATKLLNIVADHAAAFGKLDAGIDTTKLLAACIDTTTLLKKVADHAHATAFGNLGAGIDTTKLLGAGIDTTKLLGAGSDTTTRLNKIADHAHATAFGKLDAGIDTKLLGAGIDTTTLFGKLSAGTDTTKLLGAGIDTTTLFGKLSAGTDTDTLLEQIARTAADVLSHGTISFRPDLAQVPIDDPSSDFWLSGHGRVLFQIYVVVLATVLLVQCGLSTSVGLFVLEKFMGAAGLGGITLWKPAGAVYDRLFDPSGSE
jgi:hypothetical protein